MDFLDPRKQRPQLNLKDLLPPGFNVDALNRKEAVNQFIELNPDHFSTNLLRLKGLAGPESFNPLVHQAVKKPKVQLPEGWKIEPEYYEAFKKWKNSGSPDDLEDLIDQLEPLIDRSIYQQTGSKDVVLRMKGRAILMHTLPRYDPTQSSLSTFVYNQMLQLQREYRKQMMPVDVPERKAIEAIRLKQAEEELTAILGRTPSDEELADHTGLSVEKIRDLRGSAMISSSEIASYESAPTMGVERKADEAWLEYVYESLDGMDKVIFEHTVGYNGKPILSGKELAKKLNVSPAYISQRRTEIQKMIDSLRSRGVH